MRIWIFGALFLAGGLVAGQSRADDVAEQAATCQACHGEDGHPTAPEIPVIFGQQEGYLYIELRDYKSGVRKSEVMGPVANGLSRDQMKSLAAYFAGKTWPRLQQTATPEQSAIATRANGSAGCTACHMEGYLGASTAPRLAGQQQAYLGQTLHNFKTKERANNPGMSSIVETYPDEDLQAIAAYLGTL